MYVLGLDEVWVASGDPNSTTLTRDCCLGGCLLDLRALFTRPNEARLWWIACDCEEEEEKDEEEKGSCLCGLRPSPRGSRGGGGWVWLKRPDRKAPFDMGWASLREEREGWGGMFLLDRLSFRIVSESRLAEGDRRKIAGKRWLAERAQGD